MDTPSETANWYPDAFGRYQYRYWDGHNWTDQVSRDGVQSSDPPVASGPIAAHSLTTPPPPVTTAPAGSYPIAQSGYPSGVQGQPAGYSPKSKIAAGLLGIFLGVFGVHRFYLGYTGIGLTMLLLTVLTFGLAAPFIAVWGLIEGILILVGSGSFTRDARGVPPIASCTRPGRW
jgi:TM2 domain-containing membrane protein YozV